MSRNQDDPLEGIGSRRGASGASGGMEQWQAYLDHQDALDALDAEKAAEDEARAGRVAGPAPTQTSVHHAVQGITGAAGAAVAAAGGISNEDRFGVMAAMQAEALARLELPTHVDNVNAAVRTADGLDEGTVIQNLDEFQERRFDGVMVDREQQRGVDALAKPDDLVSGVEKHESRTAEERQDDRDHHRGRKD